MRSASGRIFHCLIVPYIFYRKRNCISDAHISVRNPFVCINMDRLRRSEHGWLRVLVGLGFQGFTRHVHTYALKEMSHADLLRRQVNQGLAALVRKDLADDGHLGLGCIGVKGLA